MSAGKQDNLGGTGEVPLGYASARRPGDLPLRPVDRGAEVVRWLFPAYIMLILAGFFALRGPGVMPAGNELNPDRAVFTAVNAATLTGFQTTMHPKQFFTPGKVILLILTVLGTIFTLVVGGMAVKRILRLTWGDGRIVGAAVVAEAFVLILGAVSSGAGKAEQLVAGMMRTAAAWGNSGLYLDAPPAPNEAFTFVVLLPLAVMGGLGIVVVLEVIDALVRHRPISRHAQVVLQVTAGMFLIGFAGCVLFQLMELEGTGTHKGDSWFASVGREWPQVLSGAAITSVNARTAGMSIVPMLGSQRATAFFVMLLMVVGASPGGTGGGLKTTTVYELVRTPLRILRGLTVSRTTGIAAAWAGCYLITLGFFQAMMLWAEPQMPGDRVLFVTVSALSNVGLSHDLLSMTRSSLLLVSGAMFFGRIAPLLVLWWMADTTGDAEIAIG